MERGVFITMEGWDGTGKSTQARLLVLALRRQGIPALHTFEPGDTELGSELRHLLLERHDLEFGKRAEMLLMAADRAQHVEEVIRPALEAGQAVICERYVDSTLAYQGYGLGCPIADVQRVNAIATDNLLPDLTFLFDWQEQAGEMPGAGEHRDRIESRETDYRRMVVKGYRRIWQDNPGRVHRVFVPGEGVDDIHRRVLGIVNRHLGIC